MMALVLGWVVGWLMNGLSDLVAVNRVLDASRPTWQPFGGLWRTPQPRFARLHASTEMLSIVIIGVIGARYTINTALIMTGLYAFLLLITLTDLKYRRVFNVVTYPAVGVVLLALLVTHAPLTAHLIGGAMAFGIFVLARVTSRGALGGGDIKLAGVLGLAFGFPGILWVLLAGTGLGALLAVGALVSGAGSCGTRIAYAPFLCAGATLVMLVLVR